MAAIDEFNDKLGADGHWVMACGLEAPTTAVVIDGRHRDPVFTDGPHIDSPVCVSGDSCRRIEGVAHTSA